VARDVVQGGELSERAKASMTKDLEIFEHKQASERSAMQESNRSAQGKASPSMEMTD
jgi:hypothetical protein